MRISREPKPTTTCWICDNDFPDADMIPRASGEGKLCPKCAKIALCPDCGAERHPVACALLARVAELEAALERIKVKAAYAKDNPRQQTDKLFDILETARAALARKGE